MLCTWYFIEHEGGAVYQPLNTLKGKMQYTDIFSGSFAVGVHVSEIPNILTLLMSLSYPLIPHIRFSTPIKQVDISGSCSLSLYFNSSDVTYDYNMKMST